MLKVFFNKKIDGVRKMVFHNSKTEEVIAELDTSVNGLTESEARKRLEANGKNELAGKKKKSLIRKFLEQFKDVMIIMLICAAFVSAGVAIYQYKTGASDNLMELIDSGIILIIVVFNAVMGLVQESKAEAAIEALKNMNKPYCKVKRDGTLVKIKSEELVLGDVVILEAGDIVPADLRLTEAVSLQISEAALTGESLPSEKDASAIVEENAPLGDRKNMAYSGGTVAYGRGQGVVVATGMNTEVGKIAKMLAEAEDQVTPLQKQLDKTAKVLSIAVLIISVIIFICALIKNGTEAQSVIDSFMTVVAIAVAAIPEGLPAVVTIVLAIGVQRMSKKNAIIRNLPAVETLGSCEVICTDKTGTLTLNRMTVKQLFTISGGRIKAEDYDENNDRKLLTEAMALCNDAIETDEGTLSGDPTETALVFFAEEHGFNYAKLKAENARVDEIPFDSIRKAMTTINVNNGQKTAYVKGATDMLLKKCSFILDNGEVRSINESDVEKINEANHLMASNALRVLGAAIKKDLPSDKEKWEEDLIFVGLTGMIDPPRPEVKEAVATCLKAGMKPVMITGDHPETAAAIAKEIGLLTDGGKVMLGKEVDELSDEEFLKILPECSVFARVSPENKVRIVKGYKALGKVVAMTGDGVNDAPSIKEADIGIGMGITGTDVSKGASDMILADDNFVSIVHAVEEGRKIFSNIKKTIQFLLSSNIAEVLCLLIATLALLDKGEQFLTPVMILWINLVTDSFPALALGTESAENDVMNYPPRKSGSSLFSGKTGINILVQGAMQTLIVLSIYCIGEFALNFTQVQASTMAFIALGFVKLTHCFNMRSQTGTLFNKKIFSNKWVNGAVLLGCGLMLLVTLVPPIAKVFGCASVDWRGWLVSVGLSLAIIPMVEIQKLIERIIEKKKKR